MPASALTTVLSRNAILDAIDGSRAWNGQITFNRVDPLNIAEKLAFSSSLPAPFVTQGLGVTDGIWNLVGHTLTIYADDLGIGFAETDAADANYFVSDFTKPDSHDTAGAASLPGNGPILTFNVSTWNEYSDQQQDWIVLHELGHVLGLQHPADLPASLNYSQYTIMSYNWYDLGDAEVGEGLPLTPMALDVAVLQAKYGAVANNTGDTGYGLTRLAIDTDGSDDVVLNGAGYICIWDTAGFDVLVSTGSSAALLNLNAATLTTAALTGDLADVIGDVAATSRIFAGLSAFAKSEITDPGRNAGGFFSSYLDGDHRESGGYTIANGVTIEGASGGSGSDLLIGNAGANVLLGYGGQDELFGGSGADVLDGGAGDDRVFGGLGADTVTETGAGANYLRGDEGDDSISGGSGFDDINGNMGNDTCVGAVGDDWVVGGKDNDSLAGGTGQNLVYGNIGADTCDGGDNADIVRGGQDNDVVRGGAGDDFVSGDKGDDTMSGGAGADVFHTFGESNIDRVLDFNRAEGDRVQLDPGTTYTVSQAGADTVIAMTGGGQMILVGVNMASLTGAWIFGA